MQIKSLLKACKSLKQESEIILFNLKPILESCFSIYPNGNCIVIAGDTAFQSTSSPITVRQLIEELKQYPAETEVCLFSKDTNDIGHLNDLMSVCLNGSAVQLNSNAV